MVFTTTDAGAANMDDIKTLDSNGASTLMDPSVTVIAEAVLISNLG